jgi:hypothetical protein
MRAAAVCLGLLSLGWIPMAFWLESSNPPMSAVALSVALALAFLPPVAWLVLWWLGARFGFRQKRSGSSVTCGSSRGPLGLSRGRGLSTASGLLPCGHHCDPSPNTSLQGTRHAHLWLAALGSIVLARPLNSKSVRRRKHHSCPAGVQDTSRTVGSVSSGLY